jgi:hypothetical protein
MGAPWIIDICDRAATYLRGAMGAPDLEVSNARKIIGGRRAIPGPSTRVERRRRGIPHRNTAHLPTGPAVFAPREQPGHRIRDVPRPVRQPRHSPARAALHRGRRDALGMPFFVMRRLEGTPWPLELFLPASQGVASRSSGRCSGPRLHRRGGPSKRSALGDVLAAPPGDDAWAAAELERWEKTLRDHDLGPMPITRAVIRELRRNPPPPVPDPDRPRRLPRGNVLFSAGV